VSAAYYHSFDLPWGLSEQDERRFRRILQVVLILFLFFGLVIPFLPVDKVEEQQVAEVPPRLARIIMERRAPPPPPPKVEEKKPEPKVEKPKPEPKKEVKKPEPKPEPKKQPPPKETRNAARDRARSAGIMAFADELADLRSQPTVDRLDSRPLSNQGSTARKSERSMVTSNVGKSSGGINTSALSRDTGGTDLGSRSTTRVESKVAKATATAPGSSRSSNARQAQRTAQEIQLVFDRNKSAIYSIYNRALRKNPTLQGKVVLHLTISPSGQVTACEVVSSDLNDPDLERKLALRVKRFDFGAKNVATFTGTFPIDFFPS
jgi:TonB family protein